MKGMYVVSEIRRITNHHDNNIRKWIHRFNEHGIDGIVSRKHDHARSKDYGQYRETDSTNII